MGKSTVSGVYAALLTPRSANSTDADGAALLDYLDLVARAGVQGFVLFGSTGEFIHFDIEQRIRVLTLAVRRSRVPVFVNVSHSSLSGACDLAQNAVSSGAEGVLLMPPYFYKYSDDQIFSFYREFHRIVGYTTPVYIYNLPFFTNPISPALMAQLLQTGYFAGVKDSSGDWNLFETLQHLNQSVSFQLLVGNESIYLRGRQSGADGIVSGVAGAVPELILALDKCITLSKFQLASQLNTKLAEWLGWLNRFPATVAIKQAALTRGWLKSELALPLDEGTASALLEFTAWINDNLPSLLAECRQARSHAA